jgi:hypothetical protein
MLREHIPLYINALRTGPNMCGGGGGCVLETQGSPNIKLLGVHNPCAYA